VVDVLTLQAVGSLSHGERDGVRGYGPSIHLGPLTPTLSTKGEREPTEFAAAFTAHQSDVTPPLPASAA
jgi:hypothetical protein